MPGDHVFMGHLSPLGWHPVPSWVEPPHEAINTMERVYVQLANGDALTSNLEFHHNSNDHNVRVYRCFILLGNNNLLGAFLRPYDANSHLAGPSRIYVRMPDEHNSIYSGTIGRAEGVLPHWLLT